MSIVYIVIGLLLLVLGGEYLVRSSVGLSFKLNISKMVIGLTVVSFATSAPELLVSLQAALDGHASISLGNVIGSNIANIGLVLGITAIISSLTVDKEFYVIHWPSMAIFSLLLYVFLANDSMLTAVEGALLLSAIVLFLVVLIRRAQIKSKKETVEIADEVDDKLASVSAFKIIIWLLIGGVALYFGSELLVKGAVDLAQQMGVSDRVIAVTMVAVGTSVPELAASVIAAMKKEKSISIGNLIGSNIFNIGSVLGITAIVSPIKVESAEILSKDIFWMIGFAVLLLIVTLLPKRNQISKFKGIAIFILYVVFVATTFVS